MIEPQLEWLLPDPIEEPPSFAGFGAPVATLLARRGFAADHDLARFLGAGDGELPPLALMPDAEAALARIAAAVRDRETIAIWGDYDADGMTAVAIWVLALRALGIEPIRYLPSRLVEGYGLSAEGLGRLAAAGARLVVTCDCGIGNLAEIAAANALGLEVVVTDHHLPAVDLPAAVAVVDPHRRDSAYPDPDLTGAGLAYRLADALLEREGRAAPDLAALAAIGTIADLAPMTGESRAIVRRGLAELARTRHAGLRELAAGGCEDPGAPTAREIGFEIVPRLNAAGRIADAELALDLLVETDPEQASRRMAALEDVHRRRRELTTGALQEARQRADALPGSSPLVLRHDPWPAGLIGLLAGRLCDELVRPVAVACLVGHEIRGSVRAPTDFHAARALDACADWLTKRGGHAAAGGFSADPAAWDGFAAAFAGLPRPYPPSDRQPARPGRVTVDLVLSARHLGWPLYAELNQLAPFGPGHEEPILAVTGLVVGDARRVGIDEAHLSMHLRRGYETLDAIAFGVPADRPVPDAGAPLDVVAYLERRTVEGEPRLQLRCLDYATPDASPLRDRRRIASPAILVGG